MSGYIDFAGVGKVIGIGLLLGAGLPLVFALGLRSLSSGTVDHEHAVGGDFSFALTKNPMAQAVGALCLLVVAAAIVFGIFIIVNKS